MLYLLFTAILLLAAFSGIGSISEKLFKIRNEFISLRIVISMTVLATAFTTFSFFGPINIYVEVPILFLGTAAFFYFKNYLKYWDLIVSNKHLFLSGLLIILFAGSFYPFILDHFGYYVPTIKWISVFGLVKGISNLDLLLGQMSVWHIFQAGFSSFSDIFLRMNAILLIVYLIYSIERKSWIHLIFIPVLFFFAQSPSPDLAVIIFSLMILNEIFAANKNRALLFVLSTFVFAIKPTMIWVPIFTFLYILLELKGSIKALIPGFLVLIVFVINNLWTFGYPVFPVQIGSMGLSWMPNKEILRISSEIAIQKTYDMQYSAEEISKFTFWDYVKNWFSIKGLKSKIHILFITTLIIFTVFCFLKKKRIYTFLLVSILIKSVVVLLFSAQYRFFIDVFFVSAFILFYEKISRKTAVIFFSTLSLTAFLFLSFPTVLKTLVPSFKLGNFMLGFQKSQIIKPSHFKLERYKTYQIGNLRFNVAEGYPFSFDTPLPAISPQFLQEDYNAGIFPQKISDDITDGFQWIKMSDQQKLQLKKILEELKQK